MTAPTSNPTLIKYDVNFRPHKRQRCKHDTNSRKKTNSLFFYSLDYEFLDFMYFRVVALYNTAQKWQLSQESGCSARPIGGARLFVWTHGAISRYSHVGLSGTTEAEQDWRLPHPPVTSVNVNSLAMWPALNKVLHGIHGYWKRSLNQLTCIQKANGCLDTFLLWSICR